MDRTHGNLRIRIISVANRSQPRFCREHLHPSAIELCTLERGLAPQKRINVPETIKLLTKSRQQCDWGGGV